MEDKKTHWLYRVIRALVRLFSPKYTLEGTENLPQGPCVIVSNHCHMYGPIFGELYVPGPHDVWCAGEMMHRKEVPAYAYRDFWSGKSPAVRWFYKLLSHLIAPLAELIFTNAHTIAVYHDARVVSTFRESVNRLCAGRSMVIFPEHYTEHNNIVHDFQNRFVDLARFYYKKTGEELAFVPLYLAPRLKKACFGPPVTFRAGTPMGEERERICGELMDAITAMAVALPEHTVVPYPNVSRRLYPKNLPMKESAHEEAVV